MIRPSRRAALLFSCLLAVPWLLLSFRPGLWRYALDIAVAFISAMALDAILARPRRKIDLTVQTPPSAYIGETTPFIVEVISPAGLPARCDIAFDLTGDAKPKQLASVKLTDLRQTFSYVTAQRGLAVVEAAWLRWRGPLRLMQVTRRWNVSRRTAILPNTRALRSEELALYLRDMLFGLKAQKSAGEGMEFEALREYTPGLDTRFIDWKHSARHRKMLAREFQIERNHSVVMAFDTGYLMREAISNVPRLDHALAAGVTLARVAAHGGDLIGMYAFDSRPRQYLPPARGLGAFRRLQHASAEVAYSHDETNYTVGLAELHARLPRRSLIVLFTEFVDTITAEMLLDNLRRLIGKHLVVFVTVHDSALRDVFESHPSSARQVARAVLAHELMTGRALVLQKLERLGIQCIDVPPGRLSTALINRYLAVKQRGLL